MDYVGTLKKNEQFRSPKNLVFGTAFYSLGEHAIFPVFEADFSTFPAAESPSDSWQDLELPMHTWMMVLSGVIAFWFFLSCFLAFCCGPKFVECHLCEKPIPNKQWNKHDHWDTCAKDHERFLNELPDTDYRCPT